jgi:hypothetical protein
MSVTVTRLSESYLIEPGQTKIRLLNGTFMRFDRHFINGNVVVCPDSKRYLNNTEQNTCPICFMAKFMYKQGHSNLYTKLKCSKRYYYRAYIYKLNEPKIIAVSDNLHQIIINGLSKRYEISQPTKNRFWKIINYIFGSNYGSWLDYYYAFGEGLGKDFLIDSQMKSFGNTYLPDFSKSCFLDKPSVLEKQPFSSVYDYVQNLLNNSVYEPSILVNFLEKENIDNGWRTELTKFNFDNKV